MWKTGTLLFAWLTIVSIFGIDIVRSIVHRRRTRREDMVSTQDIVIRGLLIALVFFLATIICGVMWLRLSPS